MFYCSIWRLPLGHFSNRRDSQSPEQAQIKASSGTAVGTLHQLLTAEQVLTSPMAVLAWYHIHGLPVTAVNPRKPEIKLPSRSYSAVDSPASLTAPTQTSLSIITPPLVTRKVLEEAKSVGVPSVWLQPGSFDREGLEYAKANFRAAVGGEGGMGGEGWCVLVDGEAELKAANRHWTRQRL